MAADPPAAPLLPDVVRQRVVTFAADALEHLDGDTLPPALRPVTSFARGRRARLAATVIADALEDDDFRRRVATQVRPVRAGLAAALDNGDPVAADPVEVAALAYLLRPPAWGKVLEEAVGRIEQRGNDGDDPGQVTRLREEVAAVRRELTRTRAAHKEEVAALKAENASSRRRLDSERSAASQARRHSQATEAELERVREEAARQSSGAQAEQRRLRSRLAEATRDLQAIRQGEREGRAAEAVRARLLLDTLVAAAQGLRRELALPPVQTLPADTVEAADAAATAQVVPRALSPADPELLQHLVFLPKAHLLVDGYNVTKLGWPSMPLDAQRARLLRELAPLAARSGAEVTVVFDGADLAHRPTVAPPRGIRVRFSPPGVTADDVLLQLVRAEPVGRPVVVVSSDAEVASGTTRSGAHPIPSATLLALLGARGSKTVGGDV